MTTLSNAAIKAIQNHIGGLRDDAYRYRRIGGSPSDMLVAKKLEKEADELQEELKGEQASK